MMVGAGNNAKSMVYVGNIVAFLKHTLSLSPGEHIFNYVDGPDMNTNTLVEHIRRCLNKPGTTVRIPEAVALAGGHLLDGVARLTGRTFAISAIRVRKFCESTQFRADRVAESGFVAPYSLSEGLARTIQSELSAD
jgi:nucleoside-diphosphate-sugar epimerase